MKPQICGNCEFWDRENADTDDDITLAWCLWLSENQDKCAQSVTGNFMGPEDGQSCPVYLERQDAK